MKSIRLILTAACIIMGMTVVRAHDFSVTIDGNTMFFKITDKSKATAVVTYEGSIADHKVPGVQGIVNIPVNVKHDNIVYTITGIDPKAFSGAVKLTGIIMPATIGTIGDFAFEGCTNLSKVVFPGSDVTFGQGVFFKCTALKDISFGSDWKTLDMLRYKWSDSLEVVNVPAKVEKITNLKSVKSLKKVEVDANNAKFSSHDGVLYNKDGKTLYGVPRAYTGALRIADGTETITGGALIDCLDITSIYIPASVKQMSFRETSRMSQLEDIVFRADAPITTAYKDGEGCFLLQVANTGVKIKVAKDSKTIYSKKIVLTPGEYAVSATGNDILYVVSQSSLPLSKNIKALKNFDDYEQK
ncbi:MAG: leucine-rich repeat domain-containing protein [Prevotella sp.]|nr:leucine-rich repeat domain-containing protein [Prevotella sp.]